MIYRYHELKAKSPSKLNQLWFSGEALSPTSEPRSLTESMQQMDDLLSDTNMDRLDKIDRLEALLTAAMSGMMSGVEGEVEGGSCGCQCHGRTSTAAAAMTESASQTLSTGDIVITRIHYSEEEKQDERTVCSSRHWEVLLNVTKTLMNILNVI